MAAAGFPGFEQVEEIGGGGFGVVFRAWQPAFRRRVAIKILRGHGTGDEALAMLQREAAAMGALSGHPNIVTVYEAGLSADGQPFLVMPYLPGGSVATRVAAEPMAWTAVVAMAVKIAGALESAHQEGVLHRDVKPDNILYTAYGEPQLADFGIAKVGWGTSPTETGMPKAVRATVLYAPPEVLGGKAPSAASDVYSLAATSYAAANGMPAFQSHADEQVVALMARIATTPPPRIPVLPGPVWNVWERAMAKAPEDRPASAAAFGRLLQDAQRAAGLAVTPITVPPGAAVVDDEATELFDEPDVVPRRVVVPVAPSSSDLPPPTIRIVLHDLDPTEPDEPATVPPPAVPPPVAEPSPPPPALAPVTPPPPASTPTLAVTTPAGPAAPPPGASTPTPTPGTLGVPTPAPEQPAPPPTPAPVPGSAAPASSSATLVGPTPRTRRRDRGRPEGEVAPASRRWPAVVAAVLVGLLVTAGVVWVVAEGTSSTGGDGGEARFEPADVQPFSGEGITGLLAAPDPIEVEVEDGTSVRLRWTDVSGEEAGYAIQRGDTVKGVEPPGTDEAVVTDLDLSDPVCFRVGTLDERGDASWSDEACTGG